MLFFNHLYGYMVFKTLKAPGLICCSMEASTYEQKHAATITQLIDQIQSRRDWIGVDWNSDDSDSDGDDHSTPQKPIRVLDYACGTGLVTRV